MALNVHFLSSLQSFLCEFLLSKRVQLPVSNVFGRRRRLIVCAFLCICLLVHVCVRVYVWCVVLDSQSSLRDLSSKLEELTACSTLLYRRGVDLQRDVSDISPDLQAAQRNSPGGAGAAAGRNGGNGDVALATAFAQLKSAHEKATLVKVSTTALMSVSTAKTPQMGAGWEGGLPVTRNCM